jgi:hypothetical protein
MFGWNTPLIISFVITNYSCYKYISKVKIVGLVLMEISIEKLYVVFDGYYHILLLFQLPFSNYDRESLGQF